MDNVIYISDCCGVEVDPNCGHGEDMIAICPDCHEWCGVEVDDSMESEDEAMVKALEDNAMTMKEYNDLPDYIPGFDDGEAI